VTLHRRSGKRSFCARVLRARGKVSHRHDVHVEGVASLVASLRGASRLERRRWAAGDPYDDDDDDDDDYYDYDYSGEFDGAVSARNSSRGDRSERVAKAREDRKSSEHTRLARTTPWRYRATPSPRRRHAWRRRGEGSASERYSVAALAWLGTARPRATRRGRANRVRRW